MSKIFYRRTRSVLSIALLVYIAHLYFYLYSCKFCSHTFVWWDLYDFSLSVRKHIPLFFSVIISVGIILTFIKGGTTVKGIIYSAIIFFSLLQLLFWVSLLLRSWPFINQYVFFSLLHLFLMTFYIKRLKRLLVQKQFNDKK